MITFSAHGEGLTGRRGMSDQFRELSPDLI